MLQECMILQRNARIAEVEIDIVARHAAQLLLVEVKLRQGRLQQAHESVGASQERRLLRAARTLLDRTPWAEAARIDIIGIDVNRAAGRLQLEHLRGVLPR
jgi:Holliday junction resolvase-like predicted endonuclease